MRLCANSRPCDRRVADRRRPGAAVAIRSASKTLPRPGRLIQTGFDLVRRQNQMAFSIHNPGECSSAAQLKLSFPERLVYRRAGSLHRRNARARCRVNQVDLRTLWLSIVAPSARTASTARGSHCDVFSVRVGVYPRGPVAYVVSHILRPRSRYVDESQRCGQYSEQKHIRDEQHAPKSGKKAEIAAV